MQAKVAVVYMKTAPGYQNKILEALAMEVPVVATENSYLGVSKQDFAGGIEVGKNPKDFAQKVINLIKNDEYRIMKAIEGRKFVEKYYSWEKAYMSLDSLLKEVINDHKDVLFR